MSNRVRHLDTYSRPRCEDGFPENLLATEDDEKEAARNLAEFEEQKRLCAERDAAFRREAARMEEKCIERELYSSEQVFIPSHYENHNEAPSDVERKVEATEFEQYPQYNQNELYEEESHGEEQPQYDQNELYKYESDVSDSSESSESGTDDDSEDEYVASPVKKTASRPVAKRGKKRAPLRNLNKSRSSSQTPARRAAKRSASNISDLSITIEGPIDTKYTAKQINIILKHLAIPQTAFADKVLSRSQGTLSDLLRNPKPWADLKSGKDTFRRMHLFLQLPDEEKVAICEMEPEAAHAALGFPPPTTKGEHSKTPSGKSKKARLVFTDLQRRTLEAIFKETERPSREMQITICDHLKLDITTVSNYFMNARRRSRVHQPDAPSTSSA